MLFTLSSSIVSIASIRVRDGVPAWQFTGVVIGSESDDEHSRILTTSDVVCGFDGKLLDRKVHKFIDMHFESISLVLIYLGYLFRVVGGCNVSILSYLTLSMWLSIFRIC